MTTTRTYLAASVLRGEAALQAAQAAQVAQVCRRSA